MKIYTKILVIFFSSILILLALEFFSGIILKLHSTNLKKKTKAFTEQKFESNSTDNLFKNSRYSNSNLMEEMNKVWEAAEYSSYLIFKYNSLSSELVNIGKDGYRLNNNKAIKKDNVEKVRIWIIGGTEAFGYINTDAETLSSILEETLGVPSARRWLHSYFSEKLSLHDIVVNTVLGART